MYRLAYLDTMSNAYQLQEPAPFDGTFQEKADWVARWQDVVDAEVAKLFPGVTTAFYTQLTIIIL